MRTDEIAGGTFSLKTLFDGATTYTIDYYQREYSWSESDVRLLIEDLCREHEQYSRDRRPARGPQPPYFLGPFVYYEDESHRRYLVDGQQRFTTLHLIFIITRRLIQGLGAATEAQMLDRAITTFDDRGRKKFRIAIDERVQALNSIYDGKPYEPPKNATLSVRNLAARALEIEELLDRQLDSDTRARFAVWLLNHVVMVGIRAPSQDNAYRIFETMNDRGARLTSVDLLKSFLLSNVGGDEVRLNQRWRQMLGELTSARDDHDAPARFIKAALIAKYAGFGKGVVEDARDIEAALNVWVQRNREPLGLSQGHQFFKFVDDLIELAERYRTFLEATRRRDDYHGLEAIYFNEINGSADQMIAILAAVQPDDPLTVAKNKASRIANFIDRWYVLRLIDDLPVNPSDLKELIQHLLTSLRDCRAPDDVTAVLEREVAEEDAPFSTFRTFGLRGNNMHQIRYLLARITSHVASNLGKPNEIERYLGADRSWQVEHIFADHEERHPELDSPLVFRALRNRLGVLVLLPRRDNNSLNDLPYAPKVQTYSRQNDLAAILAPSHRDRNPALRDFIKSNKLEALFRPFTERDCIEKIAAQRQELYLRLCEQIWDPVRLRISRAGATSSPSAGSLEASKTRQLENVVARSRKKLLQTQLAKMVRAARSIQAIRSSVFIKASNTGRPSMTMGDSCCQPLKLDLRKLTTLLGKYARSLARAWSSGTGRTHRVKDNLCGGCTAG